MFTYYQNTFRDKDTSLRCITSSDQLISQADQYTVLRKLAGVVVLKKKVQLHDSFLMRLSVRASWVMLQTNPIILQGGLIEKKKKHQVLFNQGGAQGATGG